MESTSEYSDISATESFYHQLSDNDICRLTKNYEFLLKIIDPASPIIPILRKIVSKEDINKELTIKSYKDSRNYEMLRVHSQRIVYKGCPWFYPSTFKHMEVPDNEVYPHLYTTLNQATYTALLQGGGVNAYTITKDLRLLILNKYNIDKLIKDYINPLIKNSTNKEYFSKVKTLMISKYESMEDIPIKDNIEISKIIAYITNALGYDGSFAENNTFLYKRNEYMINTSVLVQRTSKDKYDWEQWNVHNDFLLPIDTFNLNIQYYLINNVGFSVYNFYKKMLLPSIKLDEKFDFGTLNVNMFRSINSKDSIKTCIRAVIDVIKDYNLKFICLQRVDPKYTKELASLSEAENLFLIDKSPTSSIISTSKLDILEAKEFPDSGYYIIFKHPHFNNKRILTTDLSGDENSKDERLNIIKETGVDIIMGDLSVSPYDKHLSSIGYATNDIDMEPTTINKGISDYILTKLPNVLATCMAVNYKYSDHRLVLGKY